MSKRKPTKRKPTKAVNSKRKRTTVTKSPTKKVTGLKKSKTERFIQVPKSIARERASKAGLAAAEKGKQSRGLTGVLTSKVRFERAAENEAKKMGYKPNGSLAYKSTKLKKIKKSPSKVTGYTSKTVGKPSKSKTVSKRAYKKRAK